MAQSLSSYHHTCHYSVAYRIVSCSFIGVIRRKTLRHRPITIYIHAKAITPLQISVSALLSRSHTAVFRSAMRRSPPLARRVCSSASGIFACRIEYASESMQSNPFGLLTWSCPHESVVESCYDDRNRSRKGRMCVPIKW